MDFTHDGVYTSSLETGCARHTMCTAKPARLMRGQEGLCLRCACRRGVLSNMLKCSRFRHDLTRSAMYLAGPAHGSIVELRDGRCHLRGGGAKRLESEVQVMSWAVQAHGDAWKMFYLQYECPT